MTAFWQIRQSSGSYKKILNRSVRSWIPRNIHSGCAPTWRCCSWVLRNEHYNHGNIMQSNTRRLNLFSFNVHTATVPKTRIWIGQTTGYMTCYLLRSFDRWIMHVEWSHRTHFVVREILDVKLRDKMPAKWWQAPCSERNEYKFLWNPARTTV